MALKEYIGSRGLTQILTLLKGKFSDVNEDLADLNAAVSAPEGAGKNLLQIPASVVTQTIYGVDFTVNRDSTGEVISIVANGTPSANADLVIHGVLQFENDVILTGCPSGGGGSRYSVRMTNVGSDTGSGLNIPANSSGNIYIRISIGYTADNLTFYPMVRPVGTSADFVPYIPSINERLEDVEASVSTMESTVEVLEDSNSGHDIATLTAQTPLTMQNSKHGLLNLTQVDGKMEQDATTGKNLLQIPASVVTQTINGVTFTVNRNAAGEVESIVANGTATDIATLVLRSNFPTDIVNGDVILSGCPSGGSASTYSQYSQAVTGSSFKNSGNDYGEGVIIDKSNPDHYNARIRIAQGYTADNLIFYPMIRLATETDPTFEPYTGGIPSPNPDYPQEIKKVTVSKVKVTGKNLFDGDLLLEKGESVTKANVTYSRNLDGSFTVIGTANSYSGIVVELGTFPKGVYYIQSAKSQYLRGRIIVDSDVFQNSSFELTEEKNVSFLLQAVPNHAINETFNIQLERGTEPTAYEPYHSQTIQLPDPIDLYGTDDVKDRLYRDADGLVKVERKYGKVVFDGSEDENWNLGGDSKLIYTYVLSSLVKYPSSTSEIANIISNKLIVLSRSDVASNIGLAVQSNDGALIVNFKNGATTISEFTNHLTSNPMTVVYEKAESTPEVLSTADQIALNGIPTYDTVTYLELLDTEVEPEISGEYGVSKVGGYALEAILTAKNAQIVNAEDVQAYAYHIDGKESDPASKVTYLADAEGMTPVHMDYENNVFDYGSWKDTFVLDQKPCVLNADGTVYCYLNINDLTKDTDGNDVTEIVDGTSDFGQNVMIEFPKIYTKIVPDVGDDSSYTKYFAPIKLDNDYKDYAYIDKNGKHKEHFYMPAFNGSLVNGVMRSLLGKTVSNRLTVQQEIDACVANGDGWYTEDAGEVELINSLLILIGKSTDTQTVFGKGLCDGGTEAINNDFTTGVHVDKGMFYGTNSGTANVYTNAVKVFGIENWWGFQWRRYAGDILDNGTLKVKMCWGTEDGSTVNDYNLTGSGYVTIPDCTPSGTSGVYISEVKATPLGMFAKIASGSASTHYTDGVWYDNSNIRYAFRGGASYNRLLVGALCVSRHLLATYRSWDVGAAISYK